MHRPLPQVLLVRKKSSGEILALKAIDKQRLRPSALAHVLAESEAMQRIEHPFVMRLHGAFQDARHFFFVFEYVGGGDLYKMLTRFQSFPLEWCKIYTAEVALALSHVHDLGYIYRDLKTENVLIATDGHIKLGDFGTATKVDNLRHSQAGTVFCMAPEMLQGEKYDTAVDWWALGVLFCEMALLPGSAPRFLSDMSMSIPERLQYYATGHHLELRACLPIERGATQALALIAGLLWPGASERVHSLPMLKAAEFYKDFDWESLLSLKTPAPLAHALRASQIIDGGDGSQGGGREPSYDGESTTLKAIEKRFKTFMSAGGGGTERDPAEANTRIDTSSTALCDAAARGDLDALRSITKAGGEVNLGDYDKRTALHLAASEGLLSVVQFLIEQLDATHSPYDRWGNTPLDDALRHEHKDVASYLITKGARPRQETKTDDGSFTSNKSGSSVNTGALIDAAAKGDADSLQNVGAADLAQGDYDKRTPLHLAASEGHITVVLLLLEKGVPHSPLDRWGNSPIDDADRHGHKNCVEALRTKGATPKKMRRSSFTGFMQRARSITGGTSNR